MIAQFMATAHPLPEQATEQPREPGADVKAAGANVFVSGSGIFAKPDYRKTIGEMRELIARTPAAI